MATPLRDTGRLERIQSKGQRVRQEVNGLTAELEGALGDVEQFVREQLERRPYTTLAAASGVGWVLGGGILVVLSRVLFGMGGRLALLMVAERLRAGLVPTESNSEEKE